MLLIRISLDISGDNFSPKRIREQLGESYSTFRSHEPTDIKWEGKLDRYEYGSISILHPQKVGIQYELGNYERWYVEFLEKNYDVLIENGATEINLFLDVFYNKQCNFEIFDKSLLKRLTKYNVSLPISVYELSDKAIIDILLDAGYSKEKIEEVIQEG